MPHPWRATVAVVVTMLVYGWLDVPLVGGAVVGGLLIGWLWIALRRDRERHRERKLSHAEILLLDDD